MGLRILLLATFLVAAIAPAAHGATLLSSTIEVSEAADRSCLTPREGLGVQRRRVTTDATGLVHARLGATAGDWDLAVFDAADRRLVAGSAHFGGTELAEGVVTGGQALLVQVCRRSGTALRAPLSVRNIPLPTVAPGTLQLVRVKVPTIASKDLLLSLDLDLTEHGREGFLDVLLHGPQDAEALRRAGLAFDVLIDDVAASDRAALATRLGPPDGPMPSGRVQYRRLPEFAEDMKRLVAENPAIARPITLAHPTLEGRPVEGVEITRDVAARDGKPVFLQLGVHHAREWPSAEMAMEWAFEMVNSFNAGSERTMKLLDRARVIVVPLVNPDGFNLSRESVVEAGQALVDPGFAYKRKNCRISDGALPAPGECGLAANRDLGTDPNRNYGGFWGGPGAATQPSSDTYRGAGPFSEPETQNIKALVSARQVTTLITNHTYSDLILRPPGLASSPEAPDEQLLKALGDAMAAENGYVSQPSYNLYDTTGTTEDWSYFTTGGLGYTFEIGKLDNVDGGAVAGAGFHPPYPSGVVAEWYGKTPDGGGNREAYYLALESTADTSRHAVITGRGPAGATIRLRKSFTQFSKGGPDGPVAIAENLESSMSVPPTGAFEFHANQSTRPLVVGSATEGYQLTCEDASGAILGRELVVVSRGERLDLGNACDGGARASVIAPGSGRLELRITPRRATLRTLARRGLTVRVDCSARCDATVRLLLGRKVMGTARVPNATRPTDLRVRLSRAGARRLRGSRRATLSLRAFATGDGGSRAAATKRLRLKR